MDVSIFWILAWVLFHGGALSAAWCTRIFAGSRAEFLAQAACLIAMVAVGSAVWICQQCDSEFWIFSAITLVLTVLAAVSDFDRQPHRDFDRQPHRDSTGAFEAC